MTTSVDLRTAALLAHKGSPVPLEPARGTFHNTAPVDPSRQHQGSSTSGARWRQYDRRPQLWASDLNEHVAARQLEEKLKPLYTEKLPISPRFPTLAEAAQRRRDFRCTTIARSSLGLMVAAGVGAFWFGTGIFPAGAFVIGLIVFAATCFYSGCRNRDRML